MATVTTTAGPIDAREMGHTLPHEHFFANTLREYREYGILNDYPLMVEEVRAFAEAGGATIFDLTTSEITRGAAPDPNFVLEHGDEDSGWTSGGARAESNVLAVAQLARDTGVNIVMGTGHYRDPYYEDDDWIDLHSVDEIANRMINDIEHGFGDTGVRAGIVGEIGADKWYISAKEERTFRAAARTALATDLTVTTHASKWPVGIPQLDLLEEEGLDPRRVIIGHCDSVNIPAYHEAVAKRGAYVQFDGIRGNTLYDTHLRVKFVKELANEGRLDQVLLSHDVCRRSHLHIHSGGGYDYIPTTFSKLLKDAGIADEQLHMMMVENPRRALIGED